MQVRAWTAGPRYRVGRLVISGCRLSLQGLRFGLFVPRAHPAQLRSVCLRRGIDFLFLPPTHSRRVHNRTKILVPRKLQGQQGQQQQKQNELQEESKDQTHDHQLQEDCHDADMNQQREQPRRRQQEQQQQELVGQEGGERQEAVVADAESASEESPQQHQQQKTRAAESVICWDVCFRLPSAEGFRLPLMLREDVPLHQHALLLQQHCCKKLEQQHTQKRPGNAAELSEGCLLLQRCAAGPLLQVAAAATANTTATAEAERTSASEPGDATAARGSAAASQSTAGKGFRLLLPITAAHAGVTLQPQANSATAAYSAAETATHDATTAEAGSAEVSPLGAEAEAAGTTSAGTPSTGLIPAYLLPWELSLQECLKGTTVVEVCSVCLSKIPIMCFVLVFTSINSFRSFSVHLYVVL